MANLEASAVVQTMSVCSSRSQRQLALKPTTQDLVMQYPDVQMHLQETEIAVAEVTVWSSRHARTRTPKTHGVDAALCHLLWYPVQQRHMGMHSPMQPRGGVEHPKLASLEITIRVYGTLILKSTNT